MSDERQRNVYKVTSATGLGPGSESEKLHYSGPNRETAMGMYKRLTKSSTVVQGHLYENEVLMLTFDRNKE